RYQVEEAQAQARLQVALDREHRLAEELASASARLGSLRAELTDLSQADSVLAEQMANWRLNLETREATLADGETRLADAELGVREVEAALTVAVYAVDENRTRSC